MAKGKKKSKSDSITLEMPGTIGSAKIVFTEPTVVKGSHLTVTTHPDGKTTLEWDDDALLRDVREALLKAESNIPASVELETIETDVKEKVVKQRKKVPVITVSKKSKSK